MAILDNINLLLVGYPEEYQVGAHLLSASKDLGIRTQFFDVNRAFDGPRIVQSIYWRVFGKLPQNTKKFNETIYHKCQSENFTHLISVGIAPLTENTLKSMGRLGIKRINFLTDDPWNRNHKAPWFLKALKSYDRVCSPRTCNLEQLRQSGCKNVTFTPFGYSKCHVNSVTTMKEDESFDILFVGGCDSDRFPFMKKLSDKGFKLALFGSGWGSYAKLKSQWRGMGDVSQVREVSARAKISLCLVRKANRDGHVMRSFEAPASRACLLVEDTQEHREIFGPDEETVKYFEGLSDLESAARRLLDDPSLRARLRQAAHKKIMEGNHSYRHRLLGMLKGI